MFLPSAAGPFTPSRTLTARGETYSPGQPRHFKTPWISATVTSSCLVFGWSLVLIIMAYKKLKARSLRRKGRLIDDEGPKDTFIIPPDPAVLNGQRKPGDSAFEGGPPSSSKGHSPASSKAETPAESSVLATPANSSNLGTLVGSGVNSPKDSLRMQTFPSRH